MDTFENEIHSNEAKWEAYRNRRRQDRQFALEQARNRREIAALLEAELDEQFHIPEKIRKASKEYDM